MNYPVFPRKAYVEKLEKIAVRENDQQKLELASKLRIVSDYVETVKEKAKERHFHWSNSYAGKCYFTGEEVPANKGFYGKVNGKFVVFSFYEIARRVGVEHPDNYPVDLPPSSKWYSVGRF